MAIKRNNPESQTASEKIAAARQRQAQDNNYNDNIDNDFASPFPEDNKRREINLLKHTETIDRLVIQNKNLQRDLSEADTEIVELEAKLADSSIKISKNLFYAFLIVLGYIVYILNGSFMAVQTKLIEMDMVMKEYKAETERTKTINSLHETKK